MVDRIEILVEEPSIAEVLRIVLPKVLPEGWALDQNCFVREHEGKQDLRRSIPNKIKAACKKDLRTGFVVVQDQDSNDCVRLKNDLIELCNASMLANKQLPFKVRIVCHELEAWYLGDMDAIEKVFPRFHADQYRNKALFRIPDQCVNPKHELKKIIGDYPQIATARAMASCMELEHNKSNSLHCFLGGLLQLMTN